VIGVTSSRQGNHGYCSLWCEVSGHLNVVAIAHFGSTEVMPPVFIFHCPDVEREFSKTDVQRLPALLKVAGAT
jgi:hypothetical protein